VAYIKYNSRVSSTDIRHAPPKSSLESASSLIFPGSQKWQDAKVGVSSIYVGSLSKLSRSLPPSRQKKVIRVYLQISILIPKKSQQTEPSSLMVQSSPTAPRSLNIWKGAQLTIRANLGGSCNMGQNHRPPLVSKYRALSVAKRSAVLEEGVIWGRGGRITTKD